MRKRIRIWFWDKLLACLIPAFFDLTQTAGWPTLPATMYAYHGRKFGAVLLVGFWVVSAVGQEAGSPSGPNPLPQQGVLVLRNGQVLEGKLLRAGDLYHVVLPDGEIRVNSSQVEFSCRSLDEAYAQKRAAIRKGDTHAHLQLAQWCEGQGLVDAAASELDEAAATDPTHPMIELLRWRLLASVERAPASPGPSVAPARSLPKGEEAARPVRELPRGSVEAFSRTIQPLLLNGCTTSGCHGQQSQSEFHLLRNVAGHPPSQMLTQRNLRATLRWVDRTQPEASPLLVVLGRPHGGDTKRYAEQHPAQYQQMVEWVRGLSPAKEETAAVPRASAPKSVGTHDALSAQAMSWGPMAGVEAASRGSDGAVQDEPSKSGDAQNASAKRAKRAPSVKQGQPPERFVPADPFDPEIFNRQFWTEPVSPTEVRPGGQESPSE